MSSTEPLPDFLNESLFQEALQKAEENRGSQVSIDKVEIIADLSGGNYCSDIYRASIEWKKDGQSEKPVRLFVKVLYDSLSTSSTEYFMYAEVLPKMEQYLKANKIDHPNLSPRVYLSRKTTQELHVFEDLNACGFKICDRFVGYNLEQAELLFHKLGRYHASSIMYKEQYPEIVSGMRDFYCKSDASFMVFVQNIMKENIEYMAKIIGTWSEEFKEIAVKLRNNVDEKFKHKFLRILDKEDAKVRVLCHGDLWIKNILIREASEETKVSDAIFLDYQNSFDGSPALDISNLMMTSLEFEVLKTHRPRLIEHYHKSLIETLGICNYPLDKMPSLTDIVDEVRRTEYYTFYVLIFPFTQTNLSEELCKGMDFKGFFDVDRMKRNRDDIFSNKRVLETLRYELKRLNDLGVLD